MNYEFLLFYRACIYVNLFQTYRRGGRDYQHDDFAVMDGGRSSPPSPSIDINCVQDFPSLGGGPNEGGAMSLGAVGNSQNAGGVKHPQSKSIAHKVAAQNRLTIRTSSAGGNSRGGNGMDDEEFPSLLGVTVSTAPQNGSNHHQAATTTSVHLQLNP